VIALVDYGAGNLTSVRKALAALGAGVWTPEEPGELMLADGVIVPGVGHFQSTSALTDDWRAAIREALNRGSPLLGICVGMQWLFDGSEEAPGVPGMGLIPGTCSRLPSALPPPTSVPSQSLPPRVKIPHVGWNALSLPRSTRLLQAIPDGTQVYFTHSYAAPPVPATAAVTTHGAAFSAAVEDGLVSGVQFHPEKSGEAGLTILRNWIATVSR
jgi:glutamine amidotransferase